MRTVLFSLPLVLVASAALAQDMPNSRELTCAAASALVQERGQVVMSTGPNTFQRIVSGPGYCDAQHSATPLWIPSADQSQCLVGYYCRERVEEGH